MKSYRNAGAAIFPLGGIGAGSVGLTADGRLVDWEIFNRPNRETVNGFTHFAVKAERDGKVLDARVLRGDTTQDFYGEMHINQVAHSYGQGPHRGTMAGIRHFADVEMQAFYPLAQVRYRDSHFPGEVLLRAFNPFIPLNDHDSSLPVALFDLEIQNPTDSSLHYTAAFSCGNPFAAGQVNCARPGGVCLTTQAFDRDDPRWGEMVIATDAQGAHVQEYWYRGGWFDELTTFWREFNKPGPLKARHYDQIRDGRQDMSTLAVDMDIAPGESRTVRFVLAWYVPVVEKYWDERKPTWKNYYASLFSGAAAVADYALENHNRLYEETARFRDALMGSSLPEEVLEAIQGNLAILKSSTCLRLPNGEFYGWEGVSRAVGSCEGSCAHVWNYAYALPFLFPKLERSMRTVEYTHSFSPEGKLSFRVMLPLGEKPWDFRACVDGQMGCIIKMYRDWKISGDDDFLRALWPRVKKTLEYAWSPENPDRWDPERTGVMTGRQHHTLDMELFGASGWLEGFYLAALKAAAEMAEYLGEKEDAALYRQLFEQGSAYTEEKLFNGRHYVQDLDLTDRKVLDAYDIGEVINTTGYWNEEENQINYQLGQGCEIDQVVAAWHADLCGLGRIFDPEHRRAALEDLYRLNFKTMRDQDNPCRVFSLDGEKGLIMCAWDERDEKPAIAVPYTEETMDGFEYAAAGNMLQMGMEEEALSIVRAVRERYDGIKRNPWSEIECGASYARSMATYALLLIYSGFRFDGTRKRIGFVPIRSGRFFWSLEGAWGVADCAPDRLSIRVLYGQLAVREVVTALPCVRRAALDGRALDFKQEGDRVLLQAEIGAGQELTLVG